MVESVSNLYGLQQTTSSSFSAQSDLLLEFLQSWFSHTVTWEVHFSSSQLTVSTCSSKQVHASFCARHKAAGSNQAKWNNMIKHEINKHSCKTKHHITVAIKRPTRTDPDNNEKWLSSHLFPGGIGFGAFSKGKSCGDWTKCRKRI